MTLSALILQRLPLLAGLPDELGALCARDGVIRAVKRRQLVFLPKELGHFLGFVVQGRVQGVAFTPDEREFAVSSYAEGAHFGEVEAWGAAQLPVAVEYVAVADGSVALVPVETINQVATAWPELWRRLFTASIHRQEEWLRWRQWWNVPNAAERVEAVLAWLASQGEEGVLPAGVTQQEIAGYANTTRETVTRVMQRLQAEGRLARTAAGWVWNAER